MSAKQRSFCLQKKGVVFLGGRGSYYGRSFVVSRSGHVKGSSRKKKKKQEVISVEEWKKRITDWRNRDYMKPEDRPKESTFVQQKNIKELLKNETSANKRKAYQQSLDNYKTAFDAIKAEKEAANQPTKQYKTSPEIEGLRRKAMAWHDEVVKRSWALTDSGTGLNAELRRVEEMAEFSGQTFDRKAYLRERKKIRRQAEAELTQVTKEYRALKEQIKRLGGKTIDL